jgi:hypothetical protein
MEYGKIYDLNIKGEDYRGIYLGERAPRIKLKGKYLILVNKPSLFELKCTFSLIRFKDYRFDDNNKLILKRMSYIKPNHREINYLEELTQKFG